LHRFQVNREAEPGSNKQLVSSKKLNSEMHLAVATKYPACKKFSSAIKGLCRQHLASVKNSEGVKCAAQKESL